MNQTLLDWWACLSLLTAGLSLFTFLNILMYGAVLFHEQRLLILILEFLACEFIFGMNLYVAWLLLIKRGYEIRVVKKR